MPKEPSESTLTFLPVNDFLGHDGKIYRDLALDSTVNNDMLVWLRRCLSNGKYFLVAAIIRGHTLREEVSTEEARALYHEMENKVEFRHAFLPLPLLDPVHKKKKRRHRPKKVVK